MADENLPLVEPLRSPWRERLLEALAHVQRDLLIVGPYIKDDVVAMMKNALARRPDSQPLSVRVITRILPDDFLSGASDLAALQHLLAWSAEFPGSSMEMRVINNVHAKVWIFDANLAIVGSGNATIPGLAGNIEYGLAVSEPQLVERILHDWQIYWEQATPVDAEMLGKLCLWLDAIASDTEVRSLEKMAREKRQAVERRIGAAPHIGKRLLVSQSEHQVKRTISERQDSYVVSSTHEGLPAPEPTHTTLLTQSVVVRVPASHLWQALCWTASLVGAEPQPNAANETFLKITTKPASSEQQMLQCTWADGKRFSQATIQGHAPEAQPAWTITLGSRAVQQLADFLQYMASGVAFDDQPPSESELLLWWQPSPSRFFVSQAHIESAVPVVIPCMPAAMSSTIPVLRPPLSQITIEQELLLTGFVTLKQQWERLHADAPALTSWELSFGSPGTTSTMLLSVGPMEAPLVVSMPGTNCMLSGPAIKLCLDFASLQHVIASAQNRVRRWRLSAGRDADSVRFIPEFDHEMVWADSLVWFHELRDVGGG